MAERSTVIISPTDEPDMIKRLALRERLTPDFHEMRFYKKIPVFCYGPEQRGGIWHSQLDGSNYLGKAITGVTQFGMRKYRDVPVVFHEAKVTQARAKIKGELFQVSVEGLMMMDILYQNTIMYRREKVNIQLLDQTPDHCKWFGNLPMTNAFIYVAKDEETWKNFPLHNASITRYPHDLQLKTFPFYEHKIYMDSYENEEFNLGDEGLFLRPGDQGYGGRREDPETKANRHPLEDLNSDDDPYWTQWTEANMETH